MLGRYCCDYPHFTNEENEAQIHLITNPRAINKRGNKTDQQ